MANEKIVNLKGSDGNYVYPVTTGEAVLMEGNKNLDTVFQEKSTALQEDYSAKTEALGADYNTSVTQIQQFFAGLTNTLQQDYNQKVASLEQKQNAWQDAHSGYRVVTNWGEDGNVVAVTNGNTAVVQLPSSELGHLMVSKCEGKILYTGGTSTSAHSVQIKTPVDGTYLILAPISAKFPSPRQSSTSYVNIVVGNGVHGPGEAFTSSEQIYLGGGGASVRESNFSFTLVAIRIA